MSLVDKAGKCSKREVGRLGAVLFPLLALAFLLPGCVLVDVSLMPEESGGAELLVEGERGPKILLLDINGMISTEGDRSILGLGGGPSMVARVRESLRLAEADPEVAAVMLVIDSGGGSVAAADIIYHEISSFRERTGKPVHSTVTDLGTSGAYYAAAASERITAHPSAVVGSIGVMILNFDASGLMEKVGLRQETIKSGERKDLLSPFRPMEPAEREALSEIIDSMHERFVDVVAERPGGGLERSRVAELADGTPYASGRALELGLIDRVAYLDQALKELGEELGVPEYRLMRYRSGRGAAGSGIYGKSSGRTASSGWSGGGGRETLERFDGLHLLYLWDRALP